MHRSYRTKVDLVMELLLAVSHCFSWIIRMIVCKNCTDISLDDITKSDVMEYHCWLCHILIVNNFIT